MYDSRFFNEIGRSGCPFTSGIASSMMPIDSASQFSAHAHVTIMTPIMVHMSVNGSPLGLAIRNEARTSGSEG